MYVCSVGTGECSYYIPPRYFHEYVAQFYFGLILSHSDLFTVLFRIRVSLSAWYFVFDFYRVLLLFIAIVQYLYVGILNFIITIAILPCVWSCDPVLLTWSISIEQDLHDRWIEKFTRTDFFSYQWITINKSRLLFVCLFIDVCLYLLMFVCFSLLVCLLMFMLYTTMHDKGMIYPCVFKCFLSLDFSLVSKYFMYHLLCFPKESPGNNKIEHI